MTALPFLYSNSEIKSLRLNLDNPSIDKNYPKYNN